MTKDDDDGPRQADTEGRGRQGEWGRVKRKVGVKERAPARAWVKGADQK